VCAVKCIDVFLATRS